MVFIKDGKYYNICTNGVVSDENATLTDDEIESAIECVAPAPAPATGTTTGGRRRRSSKKSKKAKKTKKSKKSKKTKKSRKH